MRTRLQLILAATAGLALAQPSVAGAADDPLALAEGAYQELEFDQTVALADEALESGGLPAKRVALAYQLLAVASAAVGDPERSREAWIRLLALDPATDAAKDLSPTMRAPYLEAKGFWGAEDEPLGAQARYVRVRTSVRVDVIDPAQMVTMVAVRWRLHGQAEYRESRSLADSRVYVVADGLGPTDAVEYVVRLLDEHGNSLVEIGDDDAPQVDGAPSTARGPDASASASLLRSGWFWAGAAALTVGATLGVYALLAADDIEGRTRVTVGIR